MKLTRPTLLIDEKKARQNIQQMADKAKKNGSVLCPHFKTHQSVAIGQWFLEAGVDKTTVSSVDMAKYFADGGWKDITIAFPYNPLESVEITQLAKQVVLNLIVVSKEGLNHLNEHVNAPVNYLIKVDVGTHRTGVNPENQEEIEALAHSWNPQHRLTGLLAHAGHSYKELNAQEAKQIFQESMRAFESVRKHTGRNDLLISYGDTPTCSILENFPGVYELRPGNFVFYDIMQEHFGSCSLDQIAVCLATPIVAKHPERNELVVYGGAVHLSKDYIIKDGQKMFGYAVRLTEDGWESEPIAEVVRLSQEHGILKVSGELMKSVKLGDLVGILPVHSCLTADLQGYYVSLAGQRLEKFDKSRV
ncbi:MAG: alanine racemase [Marinoscillum sp.]